MTADDKAALVPVCGPCAERDHRACVSHQSTPGRGFPCNCDCDLAWLTRPAVTAPSCDCTEREERRIWCSEHFISEALTTPAVDL